MVIRSNCSNYIESLIDKKSEDYTKISKMFLFIYIVKYGTKNINFENFIVTIDPYIMTNLNKVNN